MVMCCDEAMRWLAMRRGRMPMAMVKSAWRAIGVLALCLSTVCLSLVFGTQHVMHQVRWCANAVQNRA